MSPHSKPFDHFVASCYIKWLQAHIPCSVTEAKHKYKSLQIALDSNLIRFDSNIQNIIILRMAEFMCDVSLSNVAEQAQAVIDKVVES
jgi:hypothetical protein